MARIRTVKPDFFRHESLQDLEAENVGKYPMLVFGGLWGHCDKAGRFEYRPRTLKLDILPFLPFDMAETLELLCDAGFIERYEVDGKEYGLIASFQDHQRIGGKEATEPEKYPEPPKKQSEKQLGSNGEATEHQEGLQEGKGREGNKEGKGDAQEAALPPEWQEYLQHRKEKRAKLTPTARSASVRKLLEWRDAGHDIVSVLRYSIDNGYTGLFLPKDDKKPAPAPWWSSDALIQAKGRELGMTPNPGESWQQFRGRINARLEAN